MTKPDTITVRVLALVGSPSLFPEGPASAEAIAKLPRDEVIEIRVVKDRSTPQMRLFWSVLQHVAENSKFENAERLLVALKIRLGYYDLLMLPNGKRVPVPDSISFAKMPQEKFQNFMDDALAVICDEVLAGYSADQLIREAQGYVAAEA